MWPFLLLNKNVFINRSPWIFFLKMNAMLLWRDFFIILTRDRAESPGADDSLTYKDSESAGPCLEMVSMTSAGQCDIYGSQVELPAWNQGAGLCPGPEAGGSVGEGGSWTSESSQRRQEGFHREDQKAPEDACKLLQRQKSHDSVTCGLVWESKQLCPGKRLQW